MVAGHASQSRIPDPAARHPFDLTGDLTVKVEFLLTHEQANALIEQLRQDKVRVAYAKTQAEFGMILGKE